jgi:hypothetical protein
MLCTSSYAAHKLWYSDRTFTKPLKAGYAEYLQMKQGIPLQKKKFLSHIMISHISLLLLGI